MSQPNPATAWQKRCLTAFLLTLAGCATRYVESDLNRSSAANAIGDVVVFNVTDEFKTQPPTCLGVLPLVADQNDRDISQDLRKAIHANLAPTGIPLIPLQKMDQLIPANGSTAAHLKTVMAATGCDTLISGEVSDRQARFYGVYSEVKLAASIKITRVSTDRVIWSAKHTAVVRDGGLPLNPFSLIGGAVAAGMNIREEQITRTTHDLARRLVRAIPELQYADLDSDLKRPMAVHQANSTASIHAYIASLDTLAETEQIQQLTQTLFQNVWPQPSDKLVLTDALLKKSPQHAAAMMGHAEARLALAQPEEALAMADRLIHLNSDVADHYFLKSRALLQLNQPAQAIPPLIKAAGIDGSNPTYFTALGLAYNQIGEHAMALAAFDRSLNKNPDNAYVLLQQGIAHAANGDDEEAARSLRKSMVLSIIIKDQRNASRALAVFKSMDLMAQIEPEDLAALENKIDHLNKQSMSEEIK